MEAGTLHDREEDMEEDEGSLIDVPGFCIIRMLGCGSFGRVFLAKDETTWDKVAIKKLFDHNSQEELVLSSCCHENIIDLKEVILQAGDFPCLVLEYMEANLFDILRGSFLNPNDIKEIMRQIMKGLNYLHGNGILHLDIKLGNILVNKEKTSTGKTSYKVKLADFGLSARFGAGERLPDPDSVITLGYVPPELLMGMRDYGPAVDVWSAGCVFLELLSRSSLLSPQRNCQVEAFTKIVELCGRPSEANWPGVSRLPRYQEMVAESMVTQRQSIRDVLKDLGDPAALDLLERMLTLDPAKRITAQEALESDYLKEKTCWLPVEFDSPMFGKQSSFRTEERWQPVEIGRHMFAEQPSFRPEYVRENSCWQPVEFESPNWLNAPNMIQCV